MEIVFSKNSIMGYHSKMPNSPLKIETKALKKTNSFLFGSDLRFGINLDLWLLRQLRFLYSELLQHDVKVCV